MVQVQTWLFASLQTHALCTTRSVERDLHALNAAGRTSGLIDGAGGLCKKHRAKEKGLASRVPNHDPEAALPLQGSCSSTKAGTRVFLHVSVALQGVQQDPAGHGSSATSTSRWAPGPAQLAAVVGAAHTAVLAWQQVAGISLCEPSSVTLSVEASLTLRLPILAVASPELDGPPSASAPPALVMGGRSLLLGGSGTDAQLGGPPPQQQQQQLLQHVAVGVCGALSDTGPVLATSLYGLSGAAQSQDVNGGGGSPLQVAGAGAMRGDVRSRVRVSKIVGKSLPSFHPGG
jgi:hypothetical protein